MYNVFRTLAHSSKSLSSPTPSTFPFSIQSPFFDPRFPPESFPIFLDTRYLTHLNNFSKSPGTFPPSSPVPDLAAWLVCLIAYSSRGMVVERKVDIIRDD